MLLARTPSHDKGSAPAALLQLHGATGTRPPCSPQVMAAERLWGDGFLSPGGDQETLEHAAALGLAGNARLLLLGSGLGGPARALAAATGSFVLGYEADPGLRALAAAHATSGLETRVEYAAWDPQQPAFPARVAHHALAMEPLRGLAPEPLLVALAAGLKPRGHLVMAELVAGPKPPDTALAAWCAMEGRPVAIPGEAQLTRAMERLGFAVRAVEDVSERHVVRVRRRSHAALRSLDADRPDAVIARALLAEGERWRLRLSLIEGGQLTLCRWHAAATS